MMNMKNIGAAVLALVLAVGAFGGVGMYHESEAIYTRDRRTLQVTPNAGVDVTTSPPDIRGGQGAEMINLIGENGAVRKRCGWQQVVQVYDRLSEARVTGRINGMWHFDYGNERCLIVHAGARFYRVDLKDWRVWPISSSGVKDRPSYGFAMGGKLWIVGAGGFFVYYQREIGDWFMANVANMEGLYIPTTTHGIPHEGAEVGARQELDAANLLTAKRINGCVGVDIADREEIQYRLDGLPALEKEVTVRITISGEDGSGERELELVSVKQIYDEVDEGDGQGQQLRGAYQVLMPDKEWQEVWIDGKSYYQKGDIITENVCGYISNLEGIIRLFGCGIQADGTLITDLASPVAGTDNIFVSFESADGDRAELIEGAEFGILFGEEGTVDRLLLGGFDGAKNAVYYSAPGDPSYFPASNYLSAGTDAARVIGFSRVSDGTLAIHKEGRGQEPTTYYLTMSAEADEATLSYRAIPSVLAGNLSEPLLAPGSLCDFYGDPLLLTSRGVMAVTMRKNLNTTERQMMERSRSIRAHLAKMGRGKLREARAVAHRGRYYLAFPDGDCYVADSGATYRDDAGGVQYEWYPWGNVPATAWATVDDELYFGTPDGRICRMLTPQDRPQNGRLYADRTFEEFGTGDVTYNAETGCMTFARQAIHVAVGDRVRFDYGVYERFLDAGTVRAHAGLFTLTDPTTAPMLFDGMKLVADAVGDASGLEDHAVYTVDAADAVAGTFVLLDEAGEMAAASFGAEDGVRLLTPLEGEELIVAEIDEAGSYVTFKRYEDDEYTIRATMSENGDGTREVAGAVLHDRPVEAEWYSKVFDLGDARRYKTLHLLTVSVKPGSGRLKVGYETRQDTGLVATSGIGGLDFGDVDFHDFELSGFASSFTRRLRVRRANFVRFRFESKDAEPCIVHEITMTYSYTGIIRGGR